MTELQELIKKRDELNKQIKKIMPFKNGDKYYLPITEDPQFWDRDSWCSDAADLHRLRHNLAFPDTEEGKQQAIARAKEMLGI